MGNLWTIPIKAHIVKLENKRHYLETKRDCLLKCPPNTNEIDLLNDDIESISSAIKRLEDELEKRFQIKE